jgi:hypothetical protein
VSDTCYKYERRVSYPLTNHAHWKLAKQELSERLAFEIRYVRVNDIELYVTGKHIEICYLKKLGAYTKGRTVQGYAWGCRSRSVMQQGICEIIDVCRDRRFSCQMEV